MSRRIRARRDFEKLPENVARQATTGKISGDSAGESLLATT
jgi:hypothetical protein